ncbi:MAG: chemotaxis protein CheA, partial [Calothrix sp. SM1_5_4]|nr:chemotaxis protein CheA [Calothrix sp. SM1_5_4]
MVGEISLQQSLLERASRDGHLDSPRTRSLIDLKTKLTQDLRDTAVSLRMIPVEGLFQKVERVVREVAERQGKHIQITRRGDDVTLDKLVVERMLDPMVHLARNGVDHGIETIEVRQETGKPLAGTILIRAENRSGGVVITFEDDGRGIDPERVYAKAVEKKLIDPNEPMSPMAKVNLIFTPGLSTAERVTDMSGRGVGMDVVADAVNRMGGRVEVTSRLGQGTRFQIHLPTNLSIVDALVVKVDGCNYAVPNQDLAEVVDLQSATIQSVEAGRSRAF